MTAKSKTTPKPADDGTEFPLVLAGKPVTLKASGKAAIAVSNAFGGILPAAEQIKALNIVAMATIVHVGLGRPSGQGAASEVEKTMREVSESDLVDVASACSGYLARLMTGPAKVSE